MIKSKSVFKEINSCNNVQIEKISNLRNLENIIKFMFTNHIMSKKNI